MAYAAIAVQEGRTHTEAIPLHVEQWVSTKIGLTELAEALGQPLDIIAHRGIASIIVAAPLGVVRIEVVLARAVRLDLQFPEVPHIEVQAVVPEVEVLIEVRVVALGVHVPIAVQHLEAAVIGLVAEVQEPEVVEVTEVPEAAQEAQVAATGVRADLQDHHQLADPPPVVGLLAVGLLVVGLQAAEVADVVINSWINSK